jgi:hypothetical protein
MLIIDDRQRRTPGQCVSEHRGHVKGLGALRFVTLGHDAISLAVDAA